MINPKIPKAEVKEALRRAYIPTSYSKVEKYQKCPFSAFLSYAAKFLPDYYRPGLPLVKSDALIRGDLAHKELEAWARSGLKLADAPTPARKFVKEVQTRKLATHAKPGAMIVEEMWSYDAKLKPTEYRADDEWFRIKCDLAFTATKPPLVIDHKTGKQYDSHKHQGRLYGASYLTRFPKVRLVQVEFWYLDLGVVSAFNVIRDEVPAIVGSFKRRAEAMVADTMAAPLPSPLCKWCEHSAAKGGPCKAAQV